MSIISPICGTKRSYKKRIGSAPKNVTKKTKLYLIQNYFDWIRVGSSDTDAKKNTLKAYKKYTPEVYDLYERTLMKLIEKNKTYLQKAFNDDKYILNPNSLKL